LPYKQWHPQFVTSLKEALSDALPGDVEIIPEQALSSKPLDIDDRFEIGNKKRCFQFLTKGVWPPGKVYQFLSSSILVKHFIVVLHQQ